MLSRGRKRARSDDPGGRSLVVLIKSAQRSRVRCSFSRCDTRACLTRAGEFFVVVGDAGAGNARQAPVMLLERFSIVTW
jgi:hypothetical protein